MKYVAVFLLILVFSSIAASTIGTYTGSAEAEGPEASFLVGAASNQPLNLSIEVEEQQGLNLTYNRSVSFDPDDINRVVQYSGEELPLKELRIRVESIDPVREVYEIPVTLTASRNSEVEGSTAPRVVHERDYSFYYRTELSSNYGLEGDLINSETESVDDSEPDESLNITEENSLTEENQTELQGEAKESEPGSKTTYLLVIGILLVFGYTLKEALL